MINETTSFTVKQIAILKRDGLISMGGHRKLKIYGHLSCKNAQRYVKKGQYVKQRVLFVNEEEAKQEGYRPCGCCMKKEYNNWKNNN